MYKEIKSENFNCYSTKKIAKISSFNFKLAYFIKKKGEKNCPSLNDACHQQ